MTTLPRGNAEPPLSEPAVRKSHASVRASSWLSGVLPGALFALSACSSPGSSVGSGGTSSGGSNNGGSNFGGSSTSGANTGGSQSGSSSDAGATSGRAGSGGAAGAGGFGGAVGAVGGGAGSAGSEAGGRGGAAGGSGQAYNPCPSNGEACALMPLGDSITDGYKSTTQAGYRLELFRLALKNNNKLTFVGSHESGPAMVDGVPFPKKQEGHSAWTIADIGNRSGLQQQIVGWLKPPQPHVIALMIGTNDMGIDAAGAPTRLAKLLDTITATAPNALVILAQIVPTTDDSADQRVRTYNAAVLALVKARADAGKHVISVDQHTAFTKNPDWKKAYMADGLHPNDVGYGVMANTWWPAISALLPAK